MANGNTTHLKICASAGFDIFRSEPLPHFDQSQAFSLIDIEHSLVSRDRKKEELSSKISCSRPPRNDDSRASGEVGSSALVSSTKGKIMCNYVGLKKTAPLPTVKGRTVLVALLFDT